MKTNQKTSSTNNVIPAIPVAWVLIYTDENDEEPQVIQDPWEIWGLLTSLQKDFVSRTELSYEEVDKAFVVSIFLNPSSLKEAYGAGVAKGKEIAFQRSNKIGFVEEDVGGLRWLGN